MFDRQNTIVVSLVLLVGILGVWWVGMFYGARFTEADRRARIEHYHACRTVEDDALRTLCLSRNQ